MKEKFSFLNNEKGSVLLVAVVFLALVTSLGIFATTTAYIELQIAGSNKVNKMVFYAAESGIHYVAAKPDLYGPDNLDILAPLAFPDTTAPATAFPDLTTPATQYPISSTLNIGGKVGYVNKTQMSAGSGYSAGTVFAINYQLASTSTGPNNGTDTVQAGFYRIGL
jgi:hypothetical protein